MSLPRYFIGIFPTAEIQDHLSRATSDLESHFPETKLKKSQPGDLHITLRFVGEFPEDRLRELADAMGEVSVRHAPFKIRPTGLGGFPSSHKARVVWAGVDEKSLTILTELAAKIEDSVAGLGLKRERRPYVPHFTLARSRVPLSLEDAGLGSEEFSPFSAGSLELACNPAPGSARRSGEAVYRRIERFGFGG